MATPRSLMALFVPAMVFLFTVPGTTAAYECQKCPKRDLAVFAIAVPPIYADAMLSYKDWYGMHLVGGGLYEALINNDSSAACLNFVEAQAAVQGGGAGQSYQYGMGDFAAPGGSIANADYIITGGIGVPLLGRDYLVTVSVQAAGSREEVTAVSAPYDFSAGGSGNGRQLARLLMPLMEKIRDFEKRKRSEAPAVAIDVDEGVTIEPARHFIKTHERVKVKYRLQDCDGEPLKGRILAPFATLGRLKVDQPPQTDDNGELELDFIAGGQTGAAQLRAEFQYVLPFGHEDTGGGVGKIQIVDHSLWASVKIVEERHVNQEEEDPLHIQKKSVHYGRSFSMYMYFEPKPLQVYRDDHMTPVRFRQRLAGIVPGQFTFYHSGRSYEARRSSFGLDWEITTSFSEMAQQGPIAPVQKEIDSVTYEIDPKGKTITRVDLPVFKSPYTITGKRTCRKKDYYRHTSEDCSSSIDRTESFYTGLPADPQCEEISAIGPTLVTGKCTILHSGKYETRTTTYEWEFHRE